MAQDSELRSEDRRIMDGNATHVTCDNCGKIIEREPYAMFGGNIVPFIAAKAYHVKCVPLIPKAANAKS